MSKAAVEHLHAQTVVEKELVIALLDEIETTDGEDDLMVVVVGVDEVGRGAAMGLLVGDALHNPLWFHALAPRRGVLWVVEVRLVDGEDDAADTGNRLELLRSGRRPAAAVI